MIDAKQSCISLLVQHIARAQQWSELRHSVTQAVYSITQLSLHWPALLHATEQEGHAPFRTLQGVVHTGFGHCLQAFDVLANFIALQNMQGHVRQDFEDHNPARRFSQCLSR